MKSQGASSDVVAGDCRIDRCAAVFEAPIWEFGITGGLPVTSRYDHEGTGWWHSTGQDWSLCQSPDLPNTCLGLVRSLPRLIGEYRRERTGHGAVSRRTGFVSGPGSSAGFEGDDGHVIEEAQVITRSGMTQPT